MRLLLSFCFPLLAAAQFTGFTTIGDGSVLYFDSLFTLDKTWRQEQSRIYKIGQDGVSLAVERTYQPPGDPRPPTPQYSNYYDLRLPQLSRDGSVIGFTGRRTCAYSSLCGSAIFNETTVVAGGQERKFAGTGRLSGNGRYLLTFDNGTISGGPVTVRDLLSLDTVAEVAPTGSVEMSSSRVVADDGTAVFTVSGRLSILRTGAVTQIGEFSASSPAIDAAGRNVVYTYRERYGGGRSLRLYNIVERKHSDLPTGCADVSTPALSSDGVRVMFLCSDLGAPLARAIRTVDTNGTNLRQIIAESTGIIRAIMSDDGRVVWYHNGGGRILQLDLATGKAEERIGRTPQFGAQSFFIPGSAATISGYGLSDVYERAREFPLPRTLGGAVIRLGSTDVPLIEVTPTSVTFQVPWETPAITQFEILTAPTTSPFIAPAISRTRRTLAAYGSFAENNQTQSDYGGHDVAAIHENWSSLVTPANPAVRGEIVHVYGFGFGRVNNPPPTGMPPPSGQLFPTIEPVTCWTWSNVNEQRMIPVDVLYAGLAPGLAGYYQLDIRIPVDKVRPSMQFYCNGEGNREKPYSGEFYGSLRVAVTPVPGQ